MKHSSAIPPATAITAPLMPVLHVVQPTAISAPVIRKELQPMQAFQDCLRPEFRNEVIYPHTYTGGAGGPSINSDFKGDFRSADAWMRYDLAMVRARCRELERENAHCVSFNISLLNNVLGENGFACRPKVKTSRAFGDTTEGLSDDYANALIRAWRQEFELAANFTNTRTDHAVDLDRLLLSRLAFDGEFIMRKLRNYAANKFEFTWKNVDPDYLDHNLNTRNATTGNPIKMGIELDKDNKFPVAYWFLKVRPNDFWFNAEGIDGDRYERVDARDVIHVFIKKYDSEQTRGWPWPFAAMLNLHRMGRFEEAALINAAIGASKMGFFKKTTPDPANWGLTPTNGSVAGDPGSTLVQNVGPGEWQELPWNVEPVPWSPEYPNNELGPFRRAMLLGCSASLGQSYGTMTGDYDGANFSVLRHGLTEEREQFKYLQRFLARNWKQREHEESLYFALQIQTVKLPVTKFNKFKALKITGRRWAYLEPKTDAEARVIELDNLMTTLSAVVEERTGGDLEELLIEYAEDEKLLAKYGLKRKGAAEMDPVKRITAYGLGVRAGSITPQQEDEDLARAELGLPKMGDAVKNTWTEQGGVRQPITLQKPGEPPENQDPAPAPAGGKET